MYRALGHPARLAILRCLTSQNGACCGDIVNRLPLAQSTVSQHLQVLKDAGLLICQSQGRSCQYRLNNDRLRQVAGSSAEFLKSVADTVDVSMAAIDSSDTPPDHMREIAVD
ncbi:metalloregulator ArsR/SmtB family transcription factor [Roseibium sp. TrichSKD4]|uniref:ArsR/SmtB family transcription factor n=1 Tax=Roseibium sp. TrichSKD4 TaxID=744980 RepID=UPI000A056A57